jgi:signal peptidase II
VYLVLTRNSGAAFSLASDYTFVFPIVAMVVVGWIAWMAVGCARYPGRSPGLVFARD